MQDIDERREQDEKVEAAGAYAVQMQLAASRRVGAIALALFAFGAVACWYAGTFWWLVAAAILASAAFHFVMQSCARFVSRTTGMPPEIQSHFARLYKTDAAFKVRVDALRR